MRVHGVCVRPDVYVVCVRVCRREKEKGGDREGGETGCLRSFHSADQITV